MIGGVEEHAGRRRNYPSLDGMRGVAALTVVAFHLHALLGPIQLPGAYLAVDLFFVMSGFVLANAYDDRIGRDLSASAFIRKRIVRLYPLYAASILIVPLGILAEYAVHAHSEWTPATLAATVGFNLVFLPSPIRLPGDDSLFPLNFPAWSLLFELLVNIFYAALRPRLSNRLLGALVVLSGTALAGTIIANGSVNLGYSWATLAPSPPRVVFSFFLGVAIFRLGAADRLPRIHVPAWVFLVLLLGVTAMPVPAAWRPVSDIAAVFMLLPLLIVGAIRNPPRRATACWTLAGVVSFPIYALHFPMIKYVEAAITKVGGASVAGMVPWIGLALLALMIPMGILAARLYDAPVRHWLGSTQRVGLSRSLGASE